MVKRLGLLLVCVLPLGAACGGGDGGGGTFTASVTLTDGTTFAFDEPCEVSITGDTISIGGTDQGRPFGIAATWNSTVVLEPGTFDAATGVQNVLMFIMREHPTDPEMIRISSVNSGTITIDTLGYESGDVISGTFDDVVMMRDEPDDMVNIRLDDGSFSCTVP
jgi:hypothetical protein